MSEVPTVMPMQEIRRKYPSSTVFLTYIAVMVTLLFILELVRG